MKKEIHPQYGPATFRCACGNVIETRSVHQGVMQVDLCSSCHPFFTGKQKVMDTAGRIDRFKKKFGDKITVGVKRTKATQAPVKAAPVKTMKEKFEDAKAGKPEKK